MLCFFCLMRNFFIQFFILYSDLFSLLRCYGVLSILPFIQFPSFYLSPSFSLQIRRAVLQILFPDKPFSWPIHIGIAFCLIFLVNVLVIFVPSIRDIFGLIGKCTRERCALCSLLHCTFLACKLCSPPSSSGATSAPSLIFILPGIFYIRIVPQDQEPFLSRPKIQVQLSSFSDREYNGFISITKCVVDGDVVLFPSTPLGRMLCCSGIHLHGHELVIYHH